MHSLEMFYLFFCNFFVLILSSTVFAADYTVEGSGFDDIQYTINNASSDDCVLLGSGTYTSSGNSLTFNDKNMTIQGQSNTNRVTLDGKGPYTIFILKKDSIATLRYINFVNASSIDYHTLNICGILIIENCSFNNCYGDNGHALYVFEDFTSVIIKDCSFTNNHAPNIGLDNYAVGGTIFSQGSANFKVINCYFEGNTAIRSGGAIALMNNVVNAEIINCTSVNNFAPD